MLDSDGGWLAREPARRRPKPMAMFRAFVLGLAVSALVITPAFAKGGGGGGRGGGGQGGGGGKQLGARRERGPEWWPRNRSRQRPRKWSRRRAERRLAERDHHRGRPWHGADRARQSAPLIDRQPAPFHSEPREGRSKEWSDAG